MSARGAIAALGVAAISAAALLLARGARREFIQCGPGFTASAARCLPPRGVCPAPLSPTPRGCDAPRTRVLVPATDLEVGPSDWEAEGRVAPRRIHVNAFALDAFEVTVGAFDPSATEDLARAASGMTRDEAAHFCSERGGRLPTDDEWLAAAAGASARRYPWGDTGAVCRRAAWGLASGPCASGATGPDTAGAHPQGDTQGNSAAGLHDLAGNVAEWVAAPARVDAEGAAPGEHSGAARGGSWMSPLATDLRTWSRLTVNPGARSPAIGFRCAYGRHDPHGP